MHRRKLSRSTRLLGFAALAGLVVGFLLLPLFGGSGLLARAVADDWEGLPSELKEPPLPQVSRILAADGSLLANFYYENRVAVPLAQVPPALQQAVIAVEDARFQEHSGVDVKGMLRALFRNSASGGVREGGSTLTQQYVKNVLIESAPTPQAKAAARAPTLGRKLREARYALALEQRLSKPEILDRYLNIAYFGDGAYGVSAAARHYFGVPVAKLTLPQAALLAGLVQSPEAFSPTRHPAAARERRDLVLGQMHKYGFLPEARAQAARAAPVRLNVQRQGNGCEDSRAPYFCDYVLKDFLANPAFGATVDDRTELLLHGGLTITSTLDPKVQRAADQAVATAVPVATSSGIASAQAVVQPGSGQIKAIAVSLPFGRDHRRGQNSVNLAADADHGGSTGFPAGSTFKVFVLAAALKQGLPLSLSIYAPPQLDRVTGFADCSGRDRGPYEDVGNAIPGESGNFDLRTGTWASVNTFYLQLEQRTGLCEPIRLAEAMGVRTATGGPIPPYPSFVLGGAATWSPLSIATAYATLAANGKRCDPFAIAKVVDRRGRALDLPPTRCAQALQPGLAATVTDVLKGVLTQPGAEANGKALDRPSAGKTGTVDDFQAAWFAGYTPQLASAVWLGHPSEPKAHPLRNIVIAGRQHPQVFGGEIPAQIWHDTMTGALSGVPAVDFPPPDPRFGRGAATAVPNVSGLPVATAAQRVQRAGFTPRVSGNPVRSWQPAGTTAYTVPGAGASAPRGSSVAIYPSAGVPPPVFAPPPVAPRPTATRSATPSARTSARPKPSATRATASGRAKPAPRKATASKPKPS